MQTTSFKRPGIGLTIMKSSPIDVVRACKSRANELQTLAKANGISLKYGHALDQAAHELGYRDWNAASAAGKSVANAVSLSFTPPSWQDLNRPLPRLPFRLHQAGSWFYHSISELMRWAQALESIAQLESADSRHEIFPVIGGKLPYVFVRDHGRWNDDVYRLCDRGYEEWPGITFTREDLRSAAVFQWHEQYGDHDGDDMLTVLGDGIRGASSIEVLRGLARLLSAIALVADHAFARQDGEMLPEGQGFTIDLHDEKQLTAKRVARMLGSRDDFRHRQLRVSRHGIAYISDQVAMDNIDGLAFRFETWTEGTGYVGAAAAQDEAWVDQVLRDLISNWPKPKASLINF